MKTYEGMFLLDAGNPDFEAASGPVRNMLAKYNAEPLAIKQWEDRRLCYEIEGRKRGLYVLTYFKAAPEVITEIERDCQLSDEIIRVLILRRDKLTEEEIKAETPATSMSSSYRPAETKPAEAEDGEEDTEVTEDTEIQDEIGDEETETED